MKICYFHITYNPQYVGLYIYVNIINVACTESTYRSLSLILNVLDRRNCGACRGWYSASLDSKVLSESPNVCAFYCFAFFVISNVFVLFPCFFFMKCPSFGSVVDVEALRFFRDITSHKQEGQTMARDIKSSADPVDNILYSRFFRCSEFRAVFSPCILFFCCC